MQDWNPHQIQFFKDNPKRFYRSLKDRSECHVKRESSLFQQFTRPFCFDSPEFRKVDIRPTSKAILLIPGALTMSYQYEFFRHRFSFTSLGRNTNSRPFIVKIIPVITPVRCRPSAELRPRSVQDDLRS